MIRLATLVARLEVALSATLRPASRPEAIVRTDIGHLCRPHTDLDEIQRIKDGHKSEYGIKDLGKAKFFSAFRCIIAQMSVSSSPSMRTSRTSCSALATQMVKLP